MFQLDDKWSGHGPSALAHYPSAGVRPVCIRVDEKEGLLIGLKDVRGEDPGLVVIDKVDGKVLWKQTWDVAQTYVIEYQSGYLILNTPGWREVWRLATIPDPCPPSPVQKESFPYPHPQQIEVSHSLESIPLSPLDEIWTIDMSPNHVFLTSGVSGSVRIFDRANGQCVLNMDDHDNPHGTVKCSRYGVSDPTPKSDVVISRLKMFELSRQDIIADPTRTNLSNSRKLRVSRCGNHFVTLGAVRTIRPNPEHSELTLVVVRNFTTIPLGETSLLARQAIQIMLRTRHATFAFDGHRRVLVAKDSGAFIFDISKFLDNAGQIEAFSIPAFRRAFRMHACEVTESGVYFAWPADGVVWDRWEGNTARVQGQGGVNRGIDPFTTYVHGVDLATAMREGPTLHVEE
ncbi:hypothetical protein AAF712_011542 [Marasmius tenuissimus]|uniref:Uncharacterized protein n=1 Tax=Marasmius tenuissimus TaxID=585030 RepID=A0ABR2ZK58_9AGAR